MKKYISKFYKEPIEVENIEWEIIVSVTDNNKNKIIYSIYDVIEKSSYSPYISKCLLGSFIKKIPKNILIIWFWAWAFGKYLEDYVSEVKITWIEIDEVMIEIAKKEMWVKTSIFFNLDALESIDILTKKKNNKFDSILIDIYDSNIEIPKYFEDLDFIKKIWFLLTTNWTISINFSDFLGKNKKSYEKIHNNLITTLSKFYSHILSWTKENWNISWIYNLDKNYSSEEINLAYLEKVQNCEINYDSNLIKNTILSK